METLKDLEQQASSLCNAGYVSDPELLKSQVSLQNVLIYFFIFFPFFNQLHLLKKNECIYFYHKLFLKNCFCSRILFIGNTIQSYKKSISPESILSKPIIVHFIWS